MRTLVSLAFLLVACGTGEPTAKAPAPSPQDPAPVSKAEPTQAPVPSPQPVKRSWSELVEHAHSLETRWPTLSKAERLAFYKEWTRSGQELLKLLKEEADSEELDELYHQDKTPPSVFFLADDGYAYAAIVSPSWLLRTFPDLPAPEKAYLGWLEESNRDTWFGEGTLEVPISDLTAGYQKGAALLANNQKGFRAQDIGEELDSIMRDIASLLSQPPTYAEKKYRRDLAKAFAAMTKVERHQAAARALINKFPAKGIPYPFESVESLMTDLGVLK